MGVASYELGEIRLCQGDLDGAEEAFLRAHERGFVPEPGMSLLRLARAEIREAVSSMETALRDPRLDPLARAGLLPAQVEIALAAGDPEKARSGVTELEERAATYGTPALGAIADHTRGQLELASGDVPAPPGGGRRPREAPIRRPRCASLSVLMTRS